MLYAITDRQLYAENKGEALARLVELSAIWGKNGVSFIQVREKDLPAREQVELTRAVIRAVHSVGGQTSAPCILVNSRVDVALAAAADGVHLPSGADAVTPEQVRSIFSAAGRSRPPVISVSCHTVDEVKAARLQSPDCILFAPVFEKVMRDNEIADSAKGNPDDPRILPGTGLALLSEACRVAAPLPVFALGGVTAHNAAECVRASAAGVAAIRLLLEPVSEWQHLAKNGGGRRNTASNLSPLD